MGYRTTPDIVWRREDVERLVDIYSQVDAFAIDTETVGTRPPKQLTPKKKDKPALDWQTNRVIWISLATYGRADAIACGHPTRPGPPLDEQMSPFEVCEILKPILLSDQLKIGHNIKFDGLTLSKYLGEVPHGPYADTMVQAHLLNENLPSYKLKDLVDRVFKFRYENLGAMGVEGFPFYEAGRYARFDALYDWLLHNHLDPRLDKQKVREVWELEMEVLETLFPMEKEGAVIDVQEIDALDADLRQSLADLEEEIFEYSAMHHTPPPTFMADKAKWEKLKRNQGKEYPVEWDGKFNLSATRDRGWYVYEVRGHEPWLFTEKTEEPSTAENALRSYEDKDAAVAALMQWDDIHKLHSTYVHAQRIRMHNGRLHANFKQSGTKTGRFSCSEPNLQNIPRAGTPLGKRIRSLFIAPEGYTMVVGDFEQIELRVMAHESDDPAMKRVFLENRDPHTETARMIMSFLGLDPDTMTPEQRTNYGKTPNFAIVYGAGPAKIMASTGMKERDAKAVLDALFASYSRVKPWTQWVVRDCREKLYVRTISGRKRRLPQIRWTDDKLRGYAERQAVNTKIQGTAADINKMAMCRFHKAIQGTPFKLVLSVHDELVAYSPIDMVDECKALMLEAMTGDEIQLLSVPLAADINSGARWSEAK